MVDAHLLHTRGTPTKQVGRRLAHLLRHLDDGKAANQSALPAQLEADLAVETFEDVGQCR